MTLRRRGTGRGGKGGHEPRGRVRLRQVQVVQQVLEGRTQHEIAQALGISQPAVSKIVRRVEEHLLADLAYKAERQRARQTLRLEYIYAQAMQAWQDSKQDGLRRRQRKTEHGAGLASTVAELTSENRHGDPRYLDEARKTLSDLRKVWGLDAPERIAIDASTHYATMTDEALEAELVRQVQSLPSAGPTRVVDTSLPDSKGEVSDEAE
jgi:hypothetical protein